MSQTSLNQQTQEARSRSTGENAPWGRDFAPKHSRIGGIERGTVARVSWQLFEMTCYASGGRLRLARKENGGPVLRRFTSRGRGAVAAHLVETGGLDVVARAILPAAAVPVPAGAMLPIAAAPWGYS
jgi:hypothetical protein